MHIILKIDKNMKTNSVTYNQADELTKVVRNFLEKKSTFELDSDEKGHLLNLLMGTLNLQFRDYPIDDYEKAETYCRESDAFEQYVIEFINSHWDEHHPLKELNPNSHYMSNSYGDTIQVHFNDESLFIIITMTGQY